MRKNFVESVAAYGIILLFLTPLLILVVKSFFVSAEFNFTQFKYNFYHDFYRVFAASLLQALFSSVGSLFMGFFGALGLLSLKAQSNKRKIFEIIFMLPGLLPTLFVIVACLNLVSVVGPFPFGIWGVVIVHVFMNMGLIAVVISRLLDGQMGGMIELATVEGATRFQLLRALVGGFRSDFLSLGFLVFVLSFTSFSVPLIVGANYGETLDVLIYRVVMSSGDIKFALFISLAQLIFIAVISMFIKKTEALPLDHARNYSRISSYIFLLMMVIVIAALLGASFNGITVGFSQLQHLLSANPNLLQNLLRQAKGTLIECIGVAAFCFLFFSTLIILHASQLLHRFLLGYAPPSVVIIGLAFYLMFNLQEYSTGFIFACLVVAFSLTAIPTLYRLRGGALFSALSGQMKMAKILGANSWQISRDILWPQMRRDIFFISGVGAFWASGDFALSSIIAGSEVTLGIAVKGLLGGYRIELATLLTWASLLIGIFVFIILEGIGRVVDSKFSS